MTGAIGRELERAKQILEQHGFLLEFAAGASRDEIARAERTTGLSFDNELGELFAAANGSFGKTCFAVQTDEVTACGLTSLEASLARWSDWLPHSTDDGSRDPRRIRPERYVRPTCFPFAELDGWATAAYFDVNAAELGTPAVIAYQHDPDAMYVAGESLAAFLSRSNALLEEHARDLLFVDGRPSLSSPKRLQRAADEAMEDVSLSNDIDAIGVMVQGLVDVELAKTSLVVPGSALDQAGLKDGLRLIRAYLQHGEFGIAFEHVLYMIRELELPIPTDTYAVVKRVARAMEIADDKLTGVKSV